MNFMKIFLKQSLCNLGVALIVFMCCVGMWLPIILVMLLPIHNAFMFLTIPWGILIFTFIEVKYNNKSE